MDDGAQGKRPRERGDARPAAVRRLVEQMLELGIVPRSVSVDGVTVEVHSYRPPEDADGTSTEPRRHMGHMDRLAARIARRSAPNVRRGDGGAS